MVVGLAKVESPAIEAGLAAAGLPASFVGVVIALLVLLPETLAATRNAEGNERAVSRRVGDFASFAVRRVRECAL